MTADRSGQQAEHAAAGRRDLFAAGRRTLLVPVALTVVGMVVALRVRHPFLVDDVGITARYAERIADGKGWTYNDGDRTNGASAPLYTMMLAIAHGVGIDVLAAARAIGVVCFGASIGLVAHLGRRFAGRAAGILSAVFLLTWPFYQDQVLSGMESGVAVVLGLAVLVALAHDRDTAAGILLGLALLNKLDAGLLALAVGLAVLVVGRRPPWRLAWVSGAVLAPWLLFSVVYFGSALPHSFTQKASGQSDNIVNPFDRTWILDHFAESAEWPFFLLALAAVILLPSLRRRSPPAAVALAATLGWAIVHGVTFSLLDLGDRYPWYLTVLCPPAAIGAGTAVGGALRWAAGRYAEPLGPLRDRVRRAPLVTGSALAVAGIVALAGLAVAPTRVQAPFASARDRVGDRPASDYERFELLRIEAGRWLGAHAEPGDVVSTCFGWIAFHAPQTTIDETCPLNTRERPAGDPRWITLVTYPGLTPPEVPAGTELAATFISREGAGSRVDILRIAPPLRP